MALLKMKYNFSATLCALLLFHQAIGQDISTANTSVYVGNDRWDWTIYVKAEPATLSKIEYVEYTLHPTFPNPVKRVFEIGNAAYPFGLPSNGWGTFEIKVKVVLKNGAILNLKHLLQFQQNEAKDNTDVGVTNTSSYAGNNKWNWTIFIKASQSTLDKIKCVEYTLHPTFPNPIRLVCDMGSYTKAFPLSSNGWGTFTVAVKVLFKNGEVKTLSYPLKF